MLLACGLTTAATPPAAPVPAFAQGPSPGELLEVAVPGTDLSLALAWVPGGDLAVSGAEAAGEPVGVTGFWMGVHEVTDDTFRIFRRRRLDSPTAASPALAFDVDAVSRPSPPYEDPAQGMSGPGRPAAGMTRHSALMYARWLSEKTGRLFRLPTEAEWEHACRLGAASPDAGGAPAIAALGWFADNSEGRFHEVGLRAPDALGLYDLRGNVAEWVLDTWTEEGLARPRGPGQRVDPVAEGTPRGRGQVRGGSYRDGPEMLECTARQPEMPAWKRRDPQIPKSVWWNTDAPHVGFRLASPAGEMSPEAIRAWWDDLMEEEG